MVLREQETDRTDRDTGNKLGGDGEAKKKERKTTEKRLTIYQPVSLSPTDDAAAVIAEIVSNGSKWTKETKALRNSYCLSLMTEKGYTMPKCVRVIREQFGLKEGAPRRWMREALDTLVAVRTPEERERQITLLGDRFEEIYSQAMSHNDLKTAISALEAQAKVYGLYQNEQNTFQQITYEFKFGGE